MRDAGYAAVVFAETFHGQESDLPTYFFSAQFWSKKNSVDQASKSTGKNGVKANYDVLKTQ